MFIAARELVLLSGGPDNTALGNVILVIAARIDRGKTGKWKYDKCSVDMTIRFGH